MGGKLNIDCGSSDQPCPPRLSARQDCQRTAAAASALGAGRRRVSGALHALRRMQDGLPDAHRAASRRLSADRFLCRGLHVLRRMRARLHPGRPAPDVRRQYAATALECARTHRCNLPGCARRRMPHLRGTLRSGRHPLCAAPRQPCSAGRRQHRMHRLRCLCCRLSGAHHRLPLTDCLPLTIWHIGIRALRPAP